MANNLNPDKPITDLKRAKEHFYTQLLGTLVKDYLDCSTTDERNRLMQFKLLAEDEMLIEFNKFQRVFSESIRSSVTKMIQLSEGITPFNPLDHENMK